MEISPGQTHSSWAATNSPAWDPADDADNSHTGEFSISTGGIRYSWASIPNIATFDFVEVTYTASGGVNNHVTKQYSTSGDYTAHAGSIEAGTDKTITFALRQATNDGFAIQRYGAGTENMTITITKLTFTKGTRYTVNFALGAYEGTPYGGTGTPPAAMQVVLDVPMVTVPATPAAWAGYDFAGWKLSDDTTVNAATVVTAAFNNATITAHWSPVIAVQPLTFNFASMTTANNTRASATISNATATGYTLTYGTGNNTDYGNVYAWIDITFPSGVHLHNYNTITFTYKGEAGDINSKPLTVMVGTASQLGASNYIGTPADLQLGPPTNVTGTTATPITVTFGDRANEFASESTVRFAFYIHAGGSSGTTSYTISSATISHVD